VVDIITEGFLNSCFSLLFCKANIRKDKTLYRDILEILQFDKVDKMEIPIILKNKIECLSRICQMKLEDKTDDNVIDSLSFSNKYTSLIPVLEMKRNEEVKDHIILDHVKQVRLRKKMNYLLKNYGKLHKVLDNIRDSSYDAIDDIIIEYESIIKVLYSNIVEHNRITAIEATSSLDLLKDDYKPMLDKIIEKYDRKNTTPTGFSIFDDYVFNGGFEKSRLYIFAGSAGSGKSTLLGNLITNSARMSPFMYDAEQANKKKVYIYITLENTIEEAFMRIYQSLYNKKSYQVLNDIVNGVDIRKMIVEEFEKNNATVIIKYFKPRGISCTDLMVVLDDVISEYGKDSIKGLYVDYLDVLRSDVRYDIKWMEIGDIALSMKLLAVDYTIPVITATHLDRTSYNPENIKNLNLGQMAKSIEKVEHGDCICLQVRDPFDPNLIHMRFGKNRSGKANVSIDFRVALENYKFIQGFKKGNDERINDPSSYIQDVSNTTNSF